MWVVGSRATRQLGKVGRRGRWYETVGLPWSNARPRKNARELQRSHSSQVAKRYGSCRGVHGAAVLLHPMRIHNAVRPRHTNYHGNIRDSTVCVEVALPQRQVRDGAYSPIVHTHQRRELQL